MKIQAYNIEDFKKQFYKQVNPIMATYEISIVLDTDDNFWDILIKEEVEKQLNQMQNFLGAPPVKDLDKVNIKTVFHPEFGNIRRL